MTSLFDAATSSIAQVANAVAALRPEKRAYIDGRFRDTATVLENKCSAVDGRPINNVASCSREDVDDAVVAARRCFEDGDWRRCERKRVLLALADAMEQARGELALLDAAETGRALHNCYYDSVPKAIDALRWFATSYERLSDVELLAPSGVTATIIREPVGVVGLITPWNDPLVPVMWKLGAALMMGNSVVLKPSEYSTLSILKVATFAEGCGLPKGVLNILPGRGEHAGRALALHEGVDVLGFTGSSATAGKIMRYAGESNLKRFYAECGGKSAFVVSRNCRRLAEAAECLARNIFYNQGQICSAPSRLIVDAAIHDDLIPLVVEAAGRFLPGHAFDINCRVGSLVSSAQRSKVQAFIDEGDAIGHRLTSFPTPANPLAVAPTIFRGVPSASRIAQEEVFGPVLVVLTADDLEQSIRLANATRYGLAAGIWTDVESEAEFAVAELRAGIVHVNSYGEDTMEAPFGGIRASGFGKDKSLLAYDEYGILKTTWNRMW